MFLKGRTTAYFSHEILKVLVRNLNTYVPAAKWTYVLHIIELYIKSVYPFITFVKRVKISFINFDLFTSSSNRSKPPPVIYL